MEFEDFQKLGANRPTILFRLTPQGFISFFWNIFHTESGHRRISEDFSGISRSIGNIATDA